MVATSRHHLENGKGERGGGSGTEEAFVPPSKSGYSPAGLFYMALLAIQVCIGRENGWLVPELDGMSWRMMGLGGRWGRGPLVVEPPRIHGLIIVDAVVG